MYLCHRIGEKINSNFNTREEIAWSNGALSFDGIYLSVWENRDILKGRDVTLFVMGDHVGGDNFFDAGEPFSRFCDWNRIMELVKDGAKLGWHTWSHRDLTTLSDEDVRKELTPPFPMTRVAYPHGKADARIAAIAAELGFTEGYCAGEHGDGSPMLQKRSYL